MYANHGFISFFSAGDEAFVRDLPLAPSTFMLQVYVAIDTQGSEEHHEIEMTNVI
jgi:hypothetical protein